jgi:hypothetical protein
MEKWKAEDAPRLLEFAREWIERGNDVIPITALVVTSEGRAREMCETPAELELVKAWAGLLAAVGQLEGVGVLCTGELADPKTIEPLGKRCIILRMESYAGDYMVLLRWERLSDGRVAWEPPIDVSADHTWDGCLCNLLPPPSEGDTPRQTYPN